MESHALIAMELLMAPTAMTNAGCAEATITAVETVNTCPAVAK